VSFCKGREEGDFVVVILSEMKDLGERWGYKPNNHARSMMEILTVVLPSFDKLRACPVLDTGMSGRIGGKDSLRMTEGEISSKFQVSSSKPSPHPEILSSGIPRRCSGQVLRVNCCAPPE
jgi:hypothetical protein